VNDLGIVFRGGIFTEPDHSIQFVGNSGGDLNHEANRRAFQKDESDFHVALGVGLVSQRNFHRFCLSGEESNESLQKALTEFDNVTKLDSNYRLDSRYFSPRILELFAQESTNSVRLIAH